MDKALRKLRKTHLKSTIISILTSILNLVVIGIFLMLILELLEVRRDTARISRDETMMTYFTALIVIAVMIMLFSLWIIRIVHLSLFQSRKDFNIQLRLAGIPSRELAAIYRKEAWQNQWIVVPVGLALAELLFHQISMRNGMEAEWISLPVLLAAVVLHLLALTVCLWITFRKIVRFDPVEELRSPFKTEEARRLTRKDAIRGILGVLLVLSGYVPGAEDNSLLQLLPLVGIFLLFDPILVGTQYLLKGIGRRSRNVPLHLGQSSFLGYYRKIDPILSTLIIGVMVSMGLNGMFETARVISRETVEQNVYFQYLVVNEKVKAGMTEEAYRSKIQEIDPAAKAAYGINLEGKDEEGIVNTIYAVDSEYTRMGEKFVLTDGTDPAMNLNSGTFNGIYLPDYFISDKDIGKPYSVTIGDNKLEFIIKGRFIANGSRGRYGFVSKAYVQQMMGQPDAINALYLSAGSDKLAESLKADPNVESQLFLDKESIAAGSYKNAIKGTEIFEISSYAVILISLLMLLHFLFAASGQNVFDIGRLRALGVSTGELKRLYLGQIASLVTQSFLYGTLLAYTFVTVGVTMILTYIPVRVEPVLPLGTIAAAYALVLAIGLAASYLSVRRAFRPDYTDQLTVLN